MSDKTNHEYMDDLRQIRTMMSKSSKFISLSGLSGISAGIVALLGSAAAWWYIRENMTGGGGSMYDAHPAAFKDLAFLLIDAAAVFILAVGLAIYFAVRKARIQKLPVWNKAAELTVINILIPLVVGAAFCIILLCGELYLLIPSLTLIFYGMALLNASAYTLNEVRWLGISEMILGLIAAVIPGYTIFFWATGFGVLHIVYGAVMYYRYEK